MMKAFFTNLFSGAASKFLVSVLTTVAASLPLYFGTAKWEPIAVMGIGALMTYLVPNSKPEVPPVK
jgi:hypothetical protein